MDQNSKENELLNKLKEAGKKNYFTLTLSLNNQVIEELDFTAEKYDPKTLAETRTYFLMCDLKKKVLEVYSEKEKEIQEKIKNNQKDNLWRDLESGKI